MATHLFQKHADFADEAAQRLALGKYGKGGFTHELSPGLQRGMYPALAAAGALTYDTIAALQAVAVADITATVALTGVGVLRVTVLDRGDGLPVMFEWDPTSDATTSAFVLTPDDNGSDDGRWIGLSVLDRASAPSGYRASTSNPAVTDDSAHGYAAGFHWHNTATGEVFVCLDATADAAVWKTIKPIRVSYAPAAAAKRVTATTTKTLPSGLALTLPANFPVSGRIDFDAEFKVAGSNGTDTGAFSVETSDGGVLASMSAFDMADNDTVYLRGSAVLEATGASAKLSVSRTTGRTGQTPSLAPGYDVAADLSASRTVGPYIQLSGTNAGNLVDVRRWTCEAWSLP